MRFTSRCIGRVNCVSSTNISVSFFEVLGVSESASLDEIKAAFRAKSKLLHPDVNKEATASRDFMLLRRAYTTLSTSELRAEYEAKMGMPSARARDPRFARFERWRREVLPDLRVQLDYWTRGIEGFVAAWRASVDQREQQLARLYDACMASVRQLQQVVAPQHQHDGAGGEAGAGAQGGDSRTEAAAPLQRDHQLLLQLLADCEERLAAMAVEVEGIASDMGDGTARVEREVEKRYQQLTSRYPAYPDIVWIDVWEETADQWLAQSASESQRCTATAALWLQRLQQLQADVRGLQEGTLPMGMAQMAGAGTGRFDQG